MVRGGSNNVGLSWQKDLSERKRSTAVMAAFVKSAMVAEGPDALNMLQLPTEWFRGTNRVQILIAMNSTVAACGDAARTIASDLSGINTCVLSSSAYLHLRQASITKQSHIYSIHWKVPPSSATLHTDVYQNHEPKRHFPPIQPCN